MSYESKKANSLEKAIQKYCYSPLFTAIREILRLTNEPLSKNASYEGERVWLGSYP